MYVCLNKDTTGIMYFSPLLNENLWRDIYHPKDGLLVKRAYYYCMLVTIFRLKYKKDAAHLLEYLFNISIPANDIPADAKFHEKVFKQLENVVIMSETQSSSSSPPEELSDDEIVQRCKQKFKQIDAVMHKELPIPTDQMLSQHKTLINLAQYYDYNYTTDLLFPSPVSARAWIWLHLMSFFIEQRIVQDVTATEKSKYKFRKDILKTLLITIVNCGTCNSNFRKELETLKHTENLFDFFLRIHYTLNEKETIKEWAKFWTNQANLLINT